jgi:hypothetical protein
MNVLVAVLIVVLLVVIVAVLSAPLRAEPGRRRDTGESARHADLEAAKQAKYREIRDVEMDFRTGKLSETDYRVLDRTLRAEAVEILRELDELGENG